MAMTGSWQLKYSEKSKSRSSHLPALLLAGVPLTLAEQMAGDLSGLGNGCVG